MPAVHLIGSPKYSGGKPSSLPEPLKAVLKHLTWCVTSKPSRCVGVRWPHLGEPQRLDACNNNWNANQKLVELYCSSWICAHTYTRSRNPCVWIRAKFVKTLTQCQSGYIVPQADAPEHRCLHEFPPHLIEMCQGLNGYWLRQLKRKLNFIVHHAYVHTHTACKSSA